MNQNTFNQPQITPAEDYVKKLDEATLTRSSDIIKGPIKIVLDFLIKKFRDIENRLVTLEENETDVVELPEEVIRNMKEITDLKKQIMVLKEAWITVKQEKKEEETKDDIETEPEKENIVTDPETDEPDFGEEFEKW